MNPTENQMIDMQPTRRTIQPLTRVRAGGELPANFWSLDGGL